MSSVSEAAGSSSAEGVGDYYCYTCQVRIQPVTEDVLCPLCYNGFVVEHSQLNVLAEGERDSATPNPPNVGGGAGPTDVQSLMETSLRNALSNSGMMAPGVIQLSINGGQPTRMSISGGVPSTSGRDATSGSSSVPLRGRTLSHNTAPPGGRDAAASRIFSNMFGGGGAGGGGNVEMDFINDIMNRAFGAAAAAGGGFESETFDVPFAFPPNVGGGVGSGLAGNPQDYAWGPNGFDNIISQLLGQIDNVGPPPATTHTIDQLPLVNITAKQVEELTECSVCFDYFKLDEQVKKLPCSHHFHQKCIDPWLRLHNTCPICRKTIGQPQQQQQQNTTASTPTTTTTTATRHQDQQGGGVALPQQQQPQQQDYLVQTFFPFFTPSSMPARGRSRRRRRYPPRYNSPEEGN